MKQVTFFMMISTLLLGVSEGHNLYLLNFNCSNIKNQPGEVFHPFKSINGSHQVELDYCVECRCDKTQTKATCLELQCPELRCQKVIQKEGECCKSCDISDAVNLVPEEYASKCIHGGSKYSDLTVIPSLNSSNPCEVCYCWKGEIVCDSIAKTCPKTRCKRRKLIWDAEQCCPNCPKSRRKSMNQNKTCKEHGITYQDGDTWNPYYPKFGVLDCYMCTCKDGGKICQTIPCPEVRACTDDDPYEDVTICCPKCSRIPKPPVQEEKNDTYQMPQPDPLNPVLCKSKCSHGIYKSMDEYKDQIAIETRASSSVDVYVWSLDFSSMQHDSYHSIYFNKHYVSKEFKDIGCATQKVLTRLQKQFRRKRKNFSNCRQHCADKVIDILKPVKYSDSCN